MAKIGSGKTKLRPGDFTLVVLTMGLVLFGVVMVFSSSYYYALSHDGSAYSYLIRDVAWAVMGTAAMFIMALIDYSKLKSRAAADPAQYTHACSGHGPGSRSDQEQCHQMDRYRRIHYHAGRNSQSGSYPVRCDIPCRET